MTVLQKAIKNNFTLLDFPNYHVKVFQLNKTTEKIMNITKSVLLVIGSMSLSFYVMFLR